MISIRGRELKYPLIVSPVKKLHRKNKCSARRFKVFFLSTFHFNVQRSLSEFIRIQKMVTGICTACMFLLLCCEFIV